MSRITIPTQTPPKNAALNLVLAIFSSQIIARWPQGLAPTKHSEIK